MFLGNWGLSPVFQNPTGHSLPCGCKEGPLFLRQLHLWLELKVDLELHEPVVNLVSFTVEQVWLGDTNLSIWEVDVGCS